MATYLVTQASGQQSQWVIKHLLDAGAKVHAVVRDLEKAPAALKESGITLFQGESKNFDDIFKAAQGCKGVFLNTFPYPGLEALQAKTVVEASKKARVESIVASTTVLTDKKEIWDNEAIKQVQLHDYYVSKAEVEDIVRDSGLKAYTILRPGVIHYDFFLPGAWGNFPRLPTDGEIDSVLVEGAKLPFTDANDIGKYAVAAFLDPAKFGGQEISLANELISLSEASEILTRVSGRQIREVKRTEKELEDLGISVFGQKFQLFANAKDISVIPTLAKEVQEKFGIPFTHLESALKRDIARLLESLPEKDVTQ